MVVLCELFCKTRETRGGEYSLYLDDRDDRHIFWGL